MDGKDASSKANLEILKEFSRKILSDLNQLLREIKKTQSARDRLYFSEYEIATRRQRGMTKIAQVKNFLPRYKKLLSGLQEEDKAVVFSIISRLSILDRISHPLDMFTEEEKKQLAKVDLFKQSILRINDNLYCYRDFFLPINHFEPSVFLYRHGIDKLEYPDRIKNKSILDIGAFIGDSALVLKELTDKKIYSFEPIQENYDLMLKTIELNDIKNVAPIKGGAGADNAVINIFSAGSSSSADQVMAMGSQKGEECRIYKIDDFVKENNIEVGLIKVDIEGFERQFIQGAVETIKTQKPALLLSVYHNADDFLDIKSIIEDMDLGYKFKIFKPVDGMVSSEVLLICEAGYSE